MSKYVKETNVSGYDRSVQVIYEFPNGYGASVITGSVAQADAGRPYEVAVFLNGNICYDTPVTDDVIPYLDEFDVLRVLNEIKALPIRENEDE